MRPLILISLALAALAASAAEPPAQPYPLWDGQESIAEYAKRAGLEPTKTLDLGNGVKLELVLIPAGKFVMGLERPSEVDDTSFQRSIVAGQMALVVGGGALVLLLSIVLVRSIRNRQRPQYSLAWFLTMTGASGIGLLGGLHWRCTEKEFAETKKEFLLAFEPNEMPVHEVTLRQAFYMGRCEVTQEQYQQVMGSNQSHFKGLDLPVETVSWDDAQDFCKKVSETIGVTARLPTEAEWEHACRAGTRTAYCSGNGEASQGRVAWYYGNAEDTTHPVGGKEASVFGLYDMHGNVWEWCEDDWHPSYDQGAPTDGRAWIDSPRRPYRVSRGGSWRYYAGRCRSTNRSIQLCERRYDDGGFRIVMTTAPFTSRPAAAQPSGLNRPLADPASAR